jgi:hypothetical protein
MGKVPFQHIQAQARAPARKVRSRTCPHVVRQPDRKQQVDACAGRREAAMQPFSVVCWHPSQYRQC